MYFSSKFAVVLVAILALAVISKAEAVENKKAENKWLFPGFWIPLNIPTPAPASGTPMTMTCDATTCCKQYCTGATTPPAMCTPGTAPAPPTCAGGGTLSPTRCFLASAGPTCTAALCTTCSTACPAPTSTTDAVCA